MLKQYIMEIFDESRQIYGSYKISIEINKKGIAVSRPYVARLMQEMGIKSRIRKKFIATTDSNHENSVADNSLSRQFTVSELGKVWVSDITARLPLM